MAAIAFETLAGWLLARAEELLPAWLPNGKWIGREWCIGDIKGERGQSLRINRDSGRWSDFATGQKGGDLIALWAAMHDLTQLPAARALAEKYGYGDLETNVIPLRPAVSDQPLEEGFEIPPADVPVRPIDFTHKRHGLPAHVYVYRAADRHPLMVVARYEYADGKTFVPYTWRDGGWRAKSAPQPRPLYGIDRLETHAGPTILVEGEKAADALQGVTQRSSVVTWPGGANSWKHADWSVLQHRSCILWPDADPPGFAAMQGIAGVLLKFDCRLQMIDTEGLADGFDAADLVQQDATPGVISQWIKPRLKAVARAVATPQRVFAPKTISPAVTVTENGERVSETPPSYSIAERYGLSYNKAGIHPNLANARALIQARVEEGAWEPLHYDDFLQKTMAGNGQLREWVDHDTLRLTDQMQRHFGLVQLRKTTVEDAVNLYAYEHRRNSAQEWLKALKWDQTPRLEQLFVRGFGAANNEYTRSAARCFLIGLVARVLQPGCQVDTLPVLEGEQGIRKSSALRVLGGDYHAECQESATGKDFYLVLAGKMLVEIAELHSFKRTDIERVNGIITCRTDRFRAPYERRASDHPRACVFVASTNKDDWNRDDTGARRFWPISCGVVDVEWIKAHREQLYAEAVDRYRAGVSWWDIPIEAARTEQAYRREEDSVSFALQAYCQDKPWVSVSTIMNYALSLEGINRYDRSLQQRITSQLRAWGYRSSFSTNSGKTERVWTAPTKQQDQDETGEPF